MLSEGGHDKCFLMSAVIPHFFLDVARSVFPELFDWVQ